MVTRAQQGTTADPWRSAVCADGGEVLKGADRKTARVASLSHILLNSKNHPVSMRPPFPRGRGPEHSTGNLGGVPGKGSLSDTG